MKVETKNADGEVMNEAKEMDLYVVADQVHKNHKADHINDLRDQARAASEPNVEEESVTEEGYKLTEEDANLVANALLHFASEHPTKEEKEDDELAVVGAAPTVNSEPSVQTLTDDQVKEISEALEENVEQSEDLKIISELPSNNDQDTHEAEDGEAKLVQVAINPITGEHVPVADVTEDVLADDETFEQMVERVKNSDIKIDDSPFTEEEFDQYIKSDKAESIFDEIAKNTEFDSDTIRQLLEVTNRVMKKEEFNVYKALPDKIKTLINDYCRKGTVPINTPSGNSFRNMIAEELVNEFVSNIGLKRIQTDFSKELEDIFDKSAKEISESIVGYTKERSKTYREAAENMEDADKKEKLIKILDAIDEGYNLNTLKEYAKNCKIKKYDIERPDKIYKSFLHKYVDSKFNIYSIEMAIPIILRNINKNAEGEVIASDSEDYFDLADINAFFIAFCKQTLNYDSNIPDQHAYMYYTLYNCVFTDINKGNEKVVSDEFLNNIKDVIINLRERNGRFWSTK